MPCSRPPARTCLLSLAFRATLPLICSACATPHHRNLRHEFLAVRGSGDYEGVEFLVEPRFREQFAIPQPTQQYAELLAAVPEVFVGTSARLVPVVQVRCAVWLERRHGLSATMAAFERFRLRTSKCVCRSSGKVLAVAAFLRGCLCLHASNMLSRTRACARTTRTCTHTRTHKCSLSLPPQQHVPNQLSATPINHLQVLCAEMADSFEARGLALPPWRRTPSMLSKWLPARVRDTSFSRSSLPEPADPHHHQQQQQLPGFGRISDPTDALLASPFAGGAAAAAAGANINMAWQRVDPAIAFVPFAGLNGGSGLGCFPSTGHGQQQHQALPAPPAPSQEAWLAQPMPIGRALAPGQSPDAASTACRGGVQKGLLSARLSSIGHSDATGAAALAAAALAPALAVTTDAPAYCGEPRIHKVKRGFVVAQQ